MSTWLLPENIADVLPSEARKIEELRRRLLDRFRSYGYEMVMPPLLEYLESLLTSGGADLRLRTFKLVDQLSGRTLGLRADITPQVARIDAHLLNRQGVTRLCYAGHVMHTRPRGLHATREQIQIGAEIYGHAGLEADLEIQQLMLDALHLAGLSRIRLDLGHAGVLAALLARDAQAAERGESLYDALSGKDVPLLNELTDDLGADTRAALRALPHLYGDASVLAEARARLPVLPEITRALDDLAQLAAQAKVPKWRSISATCVAMRITAARCSAPTSMACRTRLRGAAATTTSARRMAVPVPLRASRSTCASSRGFRRSRRAAPRFSRRGRRTTH